MNRMTQIQMVSFHYSKSRGSCIMTINSINYVFFLLAESGLGLRHLRHSYNTNRAHKPSYYLFVFANLFLEEVICILNFVISSISHLYFAFSISNINYGDVIRSYKCFQYTNKLRHNVVYVFSIFYDDVITPNLGYYRTDMTISSTALNQSKLLNYFQ